MDLSEADNVSGDSERMLRVRSDLRFKVLNPRRLVLTLLPAAP